MIVINSEFNKVETIEKVQLRTQENCTFIVYTYDMYIKKEYVYFFGIILFLYIEKTKMNDGTTKVN